MPAPLEPKVDYAAVRGTWCRVGGFLPGGSGGRHREGPRQEAEDLPDEATGRGGRGS
ncbi:MAG: hypothetical protein U0263_22060 [Polyangiaceae bacterium]